MKIVVFLGRGIEGLAFPTGYEERVHVEGSVAELHGDGQGVVDVDAEFLETLADDRLVRRLAQLNMSPNEVPTVGIPLARWVAMREEHTTVAHEDRDRDRDLDDHDVTLCGHRRCRDVSNCGQTLIPLQQQGTSSQLVWAVLSDQAPEVVPYSSPEAADGERPGPVVGW